MRITFVTDTFPPHVNGAAYSTYRIAKGLVDRGHIISVICPSRRFINEKYEKEGIYVYGIPSFPVYINNMRIALPFLVAPLLERIITISQPDIIHVEGHFLTSRIITHIAHRDGIPVVGTNHFMPDNLTHYLHLPIWVERRINAWLWTRCYRFFRSLDSVTTPTKTAAELFTRHGFGKPVQVISNGIDLHAFRDIGISDDIRNKYHIADKPTALMVGRLDKEKNIDVVIRAVAEVRKHQDIQLVIAGSDSGGEARKLRQLVYELKIEDAVKFTGFVSDEDLPMLYHCADVFVIASTAELQSIATMEAMASGLPVVAAKAVALPELVEEGVNGFLFPPGNFDLLSQHLIALFQDPERREKFGKASREKIQKHSFDSVLQQFEQVYQRARS